MANVVKKNQKADVPTKNGKNYSYQYVDIAQIHEYLESINSKYIQQIKRIENDDYVMTRRCFDDVWEEEWLQGCKVVDATLYGNENPAQKQGSALTYARRYSLLMAYGLATEDDDAQALNKFSDNNVEQYQSPTLDDAKAYKFKGKGKHQGETLEEVLKNDKQYVEWWLNNKADLYFKECYELLVGVKLPSEKEQDERLQLINKINTMALDTDTDLEEIHNYFKVNSISEMSVKQMNECIKVLERKVFEKIVNED